MEKKLNALMKRLNKAEKYMDAPFYDKLEGQELEDAISEREKYVPYYKQLLREVDECFSKLKTGLQLLK